MLPLRSSIVAAPAASNISASKQQYTTCRSRGSSSSSHRGSTTALVERAGQRWSQTQSSFSTLADSYEHILVERRFPDNNDTVQGGGVGLIQLNRPKSLNALCDELFDELIHACQVMNDHDDDIGCLVITGSKQKAFAAGADISEMKDRDYSEAYKTNMFAQWSEITKLGKPTIAAVNGYALGGGCELAMMCDIVLAGERAKFGQPEINIGIIPGAGGTQRLVRAVGKSRAMAMILTGEMMDATQAAQHGLVAGVYPPDELVDEAVRMGLVVASKGGLSVRMAKEAVNAADEMTLAEGLKFERRLFHSLFATKDQKEGMSAFLEKRTPNFTNS